MTTVHTARQLLRLFLLLTGLLLVGFVMLFSPEGARADGPLKVPDRSPPAAARPGDLLGAQPPGRVIAAEVVTGAPVSATPGFGPNSIRASEDGSSIVYATPEELRAMLDSGLATSVRYVPSPVPQEVQSEGLALLNEEEWLESGYTGAGVKIGVLDTGFSGYQNLLGTELPDSVKVRTFHPRGLDADGDSHGVAVAEIIHDIAPEAELWLANFDTPRFEAAVDYLVGQGVDIISMSAGWNTGPFDGTSRRAQVVDEAIDAGVMWINAAGNGATEHYGGSYKDGGGLHSFPGGDEINRFVSLAGSEVELFLSWTDPNVDLDICLYDLRTSIARELVCSSGRQNDPGDPLIEAIIWENDFGSDAPVGYAIFQYAGPPTQTRIDVFAGFAFNLTHQVAASSIIVPAEVERVITVGSFSWDDPDTLDVFSAQGPTVDGRIKPDFVAPSSVQTVANAEFVGTSAATPHVTGIAALRLSAFPGTTPRQMKIDLAEAATPLPLGEPKNTTFGFGRLGGGVPPVDQDWIGTHNPRNGLWTLTSAGGRTESFYFGDPGDLPIVCDWDGEGVRTPGLYRPETGFLYLRNSNDFGVADISIFFGIPEDLPVCGDWNGDGIDTIGVFRPSLGKFFLRNSNTQGFADEEFFFGDPADLPFAGDWDGDGIDTVGLYRPANGFVYIKNTNLSGFADFETFYGEPGDRFVVGDWDDDGLSSFGIFRPSDTTFYLSNVVGDALAGQAIRIGKSWHNPISVGY